MQKNLDIIEQKRLNDRATIRRTQFLEASKKRMMQNIAKLNNFIERDSLQFEQKLTKVVESLGQDVRPAQPYSLQQIPNVFQYLKENINKPSDDFMAIWILNVLENLVTFKEGNFTEEIIAFTLEFIQNNKYSQVAKFTTFQNAFHLYLTQLTIVTFQQNSVQTRQLTQKLKLQLLKWCRGENSLVILSNCINQLLYAAEYTHIYQMIQHGLKSVNPDISKNALATLISILEYVKDFDDVQMIHQRYPQIFVNLIQRSHNLKDSEHSGYIEAICSLLGTYSSIVYGLSTMGLIELIICLFESQQNRINNGGLIILNQLAFCNKIEMGNILTTPSLFMMWNKVSKLHQSMVRQQVLLVYSIFSGFFKWFHQQHIRTVLQQIQEHNSIISVIKSGLIFYKNDLQITVRTVQILKSLLYYCRQDGVGIIVMKILIQQNLLKYVEQIAIQYKGQIAIMAMDILQIYDYSGLKQNQQ